MMKINAKLITLIPLVISLSGCGSGGGSDNNPPPPTPKWTWMSGNDTVGQAGIYGTKGTAAPSNVPGSRGCPVSWVDSSGKLWLFGGAGYDSANNLRELNDLWKYDPTTLEWTWVSGSDVYGQFGVYGPRGVADTANVPGARQAAISLIDTQGKFWLFGGMGYDSAGNAGVLNDLWKYDPTTLEWTWVSGSNIGNQSGIYGTQGIAEPSNVPGARAGAVSWLDAQGNFWIFGGLGYDSRGSAYYYYLNDLWKYDPTTLEWTWVSGGDVYDQIGVYGTRGIADPANVPGVRDSAVSWHDSGGNLWLFGGLGLVSGSIYGELNDLWKYDSTTFKWTWMSGSNALNQVGVYGTKGTAAASNVPGGREGAVSSVDSQGKFWLFGGDGYSSAGNPPGFLNDLWKYDPTTLEWTWVSGSNVYGQIGVYGTRGAADSANVPGARQGAVCWVDSRGNLWLFGGEGWDSAGNPGLFNDLWKLTR
jgi:N-acetylneuraminic acid mutarotase